MLTNLPHRLVIFEQSRTEFEGGCYSLTLQTVTETWGNVKRVSMRNDTKNLKDQEFLFYNVTMRYMDDLNNANVLKYNNKMLKINATSDPTGRGLYLKLNCQEELNNNA
jgi:SPP1 family predicted phage head-tail adaptor